MQLNPDKLYSIGDALPMLGMGVTKFYAELKAGHIGAVKVGARTLVLGREIVRYQQSLPTIGRSLDSDDAS